jgi:conjugative transfer signal peptidase TraF
VERLTRSLAIGLLVALALEYFGAAAGLRFNGTPSFPIGLYLASHKTPQRGDLVFVALPSSPVLEMAKDRGYLNVAFSPTSHLLKRLVALSGDRVTINSTGVEVNGVRLSNSAPLSCDASGRPLQAYSLKNYVLGPGEVLLMSEYNPASFDSRYFGPIEATSIELVVRPVLTWN